MADSAQAFQGDTAIYRALAAVGVDTPIVPSLTGDEGGQTPSSEYFLHFKEALGAPGRAGTDHRRWVWVSSLVVWSLWLTGRSPTALESGLRPRMLFSSSLKLDSTLNPTPL